MRKWQAEPEKVQLPGWAVALIALLVLMLALLLVLAPADAADEWDQLLPEEYGVAVLVLPAVEAEDRGLATLSWEGFTVKEWSAYGTVLRPYWRPGFGVDAGITERKVRFGGGYLDGPVVYVRRAF